MELTRRTNYASGAPFEEKVGYSRAVKVGSQVFVGGTTSTNADGMVEGEGDAYLQTKITLGKIVASLRQAGATPADVVRVGFYVTDISQAQEVLRAYSEVFREIKPVINVCEVRALARPSHLVEIEAQAVIGSYLAKG
jgi:enamine deaminase RidA (YjgF/YER057c/UK114 family)